MCKIMHVVYSKNPFILLKLSILWEFHIYQSIGLVIDDLKVSIQSLWISINILLYNLWTGEYFDKVVDTLNYKQ